MLEERTEAVLEIERIMEEEYDYKAMRNESTALKFAIEEFMAKSDRPKLEMSGYRWQLIKSANRVWNPDKLRAALGKAKFLKVCSVTPDPDKIDDLVRKGTINLEDIEDALEEFPKKSYIKRFEDSDKKADEEAERVRAAMG
jgi:hypothetical protein